MDAPNPPPPAARTGPALTFNQAVTLLDSLKASEEHFDGIKNQCRILASTWLLATFGAMGFALTEQFTPTLAVETVVLALAVAGSTGILLLWVLDVMVYHRLLDASFAEAALLEQRHPELPQVRMRMKASQPGGQTLYYERWFYIGGISAPVLFGGALFVYALWGRNAPLALCSASALLVLLGAVCATVWSRSPNSALAE